MFITDVRGLYSHAIIIKGWQTHRHTHFYLPRDGRYEHVQVPGVEHGAASVAQLVEPLCREFESHPMQMKNECPELEEYKAAVWQFILEHCDVTERGSYFVKFHCSSRRNFENRLKGRYLHNYSRTDHRTGETPQEKEQRATTLREKHLDTKRKKKEVWQASAAERREVFARLERERVLRKRWGKLYPVYVWISHNLTRGKDNRV